MWFTVALHLWDQGSLCVAIACSLPVIVGFPYQFAQRCACLNEWFVIVPCNGLEPQ